MKTEITINNQKIELVFTRQTYLKYCLIGGRLDLMRVACQQWYQCVCILAACDVKGRIHSTFGELLSPTDRDTGDAIAAAVTEGWEEFLGPILGSELADEAPPSGS